jgi:hypothetical protein
LIVAYGSGEVVVMASGSGAITRLRVVEAFCGVELESVTERFTEYVPA